MKRMLITFIAGLGLLIPAAVGLGLSGAPTIFSPLPALTVIPALLLSDWHRLWNAALIVPPLLFFLWNLPLFRGESKVPKRSYILLALLGVLSAIYFVTGWKWGLQYEGPMFTVVVCSVNTAWLAFLGFAFARTRKGTTSFTISLFLHWMLFAWLGWYAFPWLGELL